MTSPDRREILERTLHAIADRAADAYRLVEEAHDVDPRNESGLTAAAKRLRMELLQTKAELERELAATSGVAIKEIDFSPQLLYH